MLQHVLVYAVAVPIRHPLLKQLTTEFFVHVKLKTSTVA